MFNKYGFVKESIEFAEQVEKEVSRIQLLIEQESFINACESYMLSSQIRPGMTQKNLSALQDQGNDLLKGFDKFDYEADKQCVNLRSSLQTRIKEISDALVEFKEKLDSIWNAVYDAASIDDVRHVHARIEAILSSGLTDRDRIDLESIDRDISAFLSDISEFVKRDYSRETIASACEELKTNYEGNDFDVSVVINGLLKEMLEKMDEEERQWCDQFLTIIPETLEQHDLDKWKRDTQPLPLYLSNKVIVDYKVMYDRVEHELANQRVNYIAMLFEQLSEQEKKRVLELLL